MMGTPDDTHVNSHTMFSSGTKIHPVEVRPMTPEMHKTTLRKPRRQSSLSLTSTQVERVCRALRNMWVQHGSQVRVAQELGVSQQTVSGVLARRSASPAFAAVVARALGVPYEQLLGPRHATASMIAPTRCVELPSSGQPG